MTYSHSVSRAQVGSAAAAFLLLLAACGGTVSSDDAASAPQVEAGTSAQTPATGVDGTAEDNADSGDLPAVPMLSVPSGEIVDLASLAPSPTPLVLWFWAPH